MLYDELYYAYSSKRMTINAKKGMVCASQALAAQAGIDMLKKGGNAVDAALATAIALTVLDPVGNGIGGDACAIIWMKNKLYGLNAVGPSPGLTDAGKLRAGGHGFIPAHGWIPVTVPGQPAGWHALSERFGKLPFGDLFEPAVTYARDGYPVSPITAREWGIAYDEYLKDLIKDDCFKPWFDTFANLGRAPRSAEMWSCESLAKTLESLAATKCGEFYKGNIAESIDYYSKKNGGFLRAGDLEKYEAEWIEPLKVDYKGYEVWELAQNCQGLAALISLGILNGFEPDMHGSTDTCHTQLEAVKLAFAEAAQYADDPEFTAVPGQLLTKEYFAGRRSLIGENARHPDTGNPVHGSASYLCTADSDGNMVSYIQGCHQSFGSGIVIPGTGIVMHNRGNCFSLAEGQAGCAGPGVRPYHSMIPGFLTKNGRPVGPFGAMGGSLQPQGHVQLIMNSIDFNMNPQQALDAPRWQWTGGREVEIENGFSGEIAYTLLGLGHNIRIAPGFLNFGRGQIIWRDDDGVFTGGTEPRADGAVAAW